MRAFILNGLWGRRHICHHHLWQLGDHARERGTLIVPRITDNLTDVIYLAPCHLIAHYHVCNHHTSAADGVLSSDHLLVGTSYHKDVEPQIIVERPVNLIELSYGRLPVNPFALGHKSDMCKRHLGHRLQ